MAKLKMTPTQRKLFALLQKHTRENRFFDFYEMKKKCAEVKSFDLSFNALYGKRLVLYHDKPLGDNSTWELNRRDERTR